MPGSVVVGFGPAGIQRRHSLLEIGRDIVPVLDPDREPREVAAESQLPAAFLSEIALGGGSRMLDRRMHRSEHQGLDDQAQGVHEAERCGLIRIERLARDEACRVMLPPVPRRGGVGQLDRAESLPKNISWAPQVDIGVHLACYESICGENSALTRFA